MTTSAIRAPTMSLKDRRAFSGSSVNDMQKAKRFYSEALGRADR